MAVAVRVTKSNVTRTCAICERTLLMGEHTLRYSPDGHEFVDVCPLCSVRPVSVALVAVPADFQPTRYPLPGSVADVPMAY